MDRSNSKVKKPWYKRWKVWVVVIVALNVIGLFMPEEDSEVAKESKNAEIVDKEMAKSEETVDDADVAKEEEDRARVAEIKKEQEAEQAKKDAEAEEERISKQEEERLAKVEEMAPKIDALNNEEIGRVIADSEGQILKIVPSEDSIGWQISEIHVTNIWHEMSDAQKMEMAELFGKFSSSVLLNVDYFNIYDADGNMVMEQQYDGTYKRVDK